MTTEEWNKLPEDIRAKAIELVLKLWVEEHSKWFGQYETSAYDSLTEAMRLAVEAQHPGPVRTDYGTITHLISSFDGMEYFDEERRKEEIKNLITRVVREAQRA